MQPKLASTPIGRDSVSRKCSKSFKVAHISSALYIRTPSLSMQAAGTSSSFRQYEAVFIMEKPAVLLPIHTSPPGESELTRPTKEYISPLKCPMLFSRVPVSRCFQRSGLPSGVAHPGIMADVHA